MIGVVNFLVEAILVVLFVKLYGENVVASVCGLKHVALRKYSLVLFFLIL